MTDEAEPATPTRSRPSERFQLTFGKETDGPVLLEQAFDQTRMAMCVTDPRLPDNPIVYVNRAFEVLTGYEAAEIVGGNCRFLQGDDTDPEAVRQIRTALDAEDVCIIELVNYRKNGEAFWNALHIGPIYDEHGELRYYFGSPWDVTNVHAARALDQQIRTINHELNHRIKNLFAVIGSIVSLSATGEGDKDAAALRARERIAALGRAHEATINPALDGSTAMLGELVEEVLAPFRNQTSAPVEASGEEVCLQISAITPIGLILHELATNSVKYGTLGDHGDGLSLTWEVKTLEDAESLRMIWRDRSSPDTDVLAHKGMGSRIMMAMATSFQGSYRARVDGDVYELRIDMPTEAVLQPRSPVVAKSQAYTIPPSREDA